MTFHEWLRAVAARLCDARTMELVIDPVLTDLEDAYRNTIAEGRMWKARSVRAAGCLVFLKVIGLYAYDRTMHDWSVDDGSVLLRTAGLSAAAFVSAALLIISPTVRSTPANLLLYQIPQSLPLAIPVAIALGIFCGLNSRVVSVRLRMAVLVLALLASATSLAATVWIIPAAGRAFRVSVSEDPHVTTGRNATFSPGMIEQPLSALRSSVDVLTRSGRPGAARQAAFTYYLRWALPCAPFVIALFALSVMPRRLVRGWIPPAAACGACLAYYLILVIADLVTRQPQFPIVAIAAYVWLPNLMFAGASAALIVVGEGSSPSTRG